MQVWLNHIDGVDDALVALKMSKRTWMRGEEDDIRELVRCSSEHCGRICAEEGSLLKKKLDVLLRIGQKHITLLKFIDLSFTVEGLHRAGQDDWDSHAARFHNRIIRSSTRLAKYGQKERSEFYKGRILTTDDVAEMFGVDLPEAVTVGKDTFVKAPYGYVRQDLVEDKDVLRGLYPLSIPSNFIFKVSLADFAHVYKQRRKEGTANPEVKQLCEACTDLICNAIPGVDRDYLMRVAENL